MLLIRDIFHCRPGKVRPMVEKFIAMAKITEKKGLGRTKIMTDVTGDRFWTVVAEFEVESFDQFMNMAMDPDDMKEFEKIMKDYHDLIDTGRREIYRIEG